MTPRGRGAGGDPPHPNPNSQPAALPRVARGRRAWREVACRERREKGKEEAVKAAWRAGDPDSDWLASAVPMLASRRARDCGSKVTPARCRGRTDSVYYMLRKLTHGTVQRAGCTEIKQQGSLAHGIELNAHIQ